MVPSLHGPELVPLRKPRTNILRVVTDSKQEADDKADDAPGLEAGDDDLEIYEGQSQEETDNTAKARAN